jgi:hypothetical protein
MGAAGDMLTGALLELMPDRDEAVARLNSIGLQGIRYEATDSVKCGVSGTHVTVTYKGMEEITQDVDIPEEDLPVAQAAMEEGMQGHPHHDHEHGSHHDHAHEHDHAHRTLADIEEIIYSLKLPESVREDVIGVYEIIAEAEGIAHDEPASEVHFHEVGSMDAVADAAAVCLLMNEIMPDAVAVSDIHVGAGHVMCAHGLLPVPAPATRNILAGLPTYGGEVQGELCTPTGAALLKYFGTEFGADREKFEAGGAVTESGHGMGRKDFDRPNCVTVLLKSQLPTACRSGGL